MRSGRGGSLVTDENNSPLDWRDHHFLQKSSSKSNVKQKSVVASWLNKKRNRPKWSFDYLAEQLRFDDLIEILHGSAYEDGILKVWLRESCKNNNTPLHRLLHYQPPREIVDLVASLLCIWTDVCSPTCDVFVAEDSRDMYGRTPLHVAVAMGCSLDVVERLLEGGTCAMPVFARDVYGRFPLHWACANPSGSTPLMPKKLPGPKKTLDFSSLKCAIRTDDDKPIPLEASPENMLNVIHLLATIYPEAASMRDDSGSTPLDFAKQYKASNDIIQLLQEAAKRRKHVGPPTCEESTKETGYRLELKAKPFCKADDSVSSLGGDWDLSTVGSPRKSPARMTSLGKGFAKAKVPVIVETSESQLEIQNLRLAL